MISEISSYFISSKYLRLNTILCFSGSLMIAFCNSVCSLSPLKYASCSSFLTRIESDESKENIVRSFCLRRKLNASFVAIRYIHVKSCASPPEGRKRSPDLYEDLLDQIISVIVTVNKPADMQVKPFGIVFYYMVEGLFALSAIIKVYDFLVCHTL